MRYIDADKLIYDIKNCLWDWDSVDGIKSSAVLKQIISDIENQPTEDVVPSTHSTLIMDEDGDSYCSLCNSFFLGGEYCSKCGARIIMKDVYLEASDPRYLVESNGEDT